MNIKSFQKDLQSGMTIQDGLKKHGLTLEEAFTQLQYHHQPPIPKPFKKTELYIVTDGNRYIIRKYTGGKVQYYGSYNSLEDAKQVRDWFIYHRWDKRWIARACKETGVTRRQHKRRGTDGKFIQ